MELKGGEKDEKRGGKQGRVAIYNNSKLIKKALKIN